jgi:biopolymer transport protein ExbD
VTIGLTETTATWSGGASGSAPITGGHLGRLTEAVKPLDDMACRIILRADADIRYDAVIAVLEAAYAARPFKMSIMTPDGGRLNASPPTSGAAGTAVRDATPITIDKKGIKVGATLAAALDDADIPTKVSAGLSAAQQVGTRGIMVTLKAEPAMHYKLFGSVLTGVKASGFVTVLFQ